VRALLLTLLLTGCNNSEPPKVEEVVAKAPRPAKARKDVLAEKILAAVAADDFERLRPMFHIRGVDRTETDALADEMARSVTRLREAAAARNIDLGKAKLLRVDEGGDQIKMFDVFLEANGQVYQTHFSAMPAAGGGYTLLGIASWIVLESEMSKNEAR
jgi:phage-related tail protein